MRKLAAVFDIVKDVAAILCGERGPRAILQPATRERVGMFWTTDQRSHSRLSPAATVRRSQSSDDILESCDLNLEVHVIIDPAGFTCQLINTITILKKIYLHKITKLQKSNGRPHRCPQK